MTQSWKHCADLIGQYSVHVLKCHTLYHKYVQLLHFNHFFIWSFIFEYAYVNSMGWIHCKDLIHVYIVLKHVYDLYYISIFLFLPQNPNFMEMQTLLLNLINLFFSFLCWVLVHCGIYNGSYIVLTISYLNLPLPPITFISPPTSWFLDKFQQVPFLHLHTIFAPCSLFYPLLLPPNPPTCANPSLCVGPVLPSCFLILQKRKEKKEKEKHDTFASLR
jgi:hypothetical protein